MNKPLISRYQNYRTNTNWKCPIITPAGPDLPNAILLTYPDAGHGSLFHFHESFVRQASLFLDSEKQKAERPDRTRASSSDVLLPARSNESKT
jgi:hypothetical protein